MRMMRSAAPGSTSSYPSRMSGVGRGPEIRRSSCRTCVITRPDWSGGPLFGFAGGRDDFFRAGRRFRLMTNPRGCVSDTLPYTTPVVSNSLLGRCSRDETFVAAWIRVDIHDTSRSAEHGAHSIGHRDLLDDDCMGSGAVRPFCSHPGLLTERGICHMARKIAREDGPHGPRARGRPLTRSLGDSATRNRGCPRRTLAQVPSANAVDGWDRRRGRPGQRGGRTEPPPRTLMVQDTGSGALRPR